MDRQEHLEWCKKRAMEYVVRGDLNEAITSMMSDIGKHEETKDHPGKELGLMFMLKGVKKSDIVKFIEGFH